VSTHQTDRHPDVAWGSQPGCGWREFTAARERFFARLAAQSASWTAARRLPERPGQRYDRAPAGQGEGARSQ
jgi:hypothetical protein